MSRRTGALGDYAPVNSSSSTDLDHNSNHSGPLQARLAHAAASSPPPSPRITTITTATSSAAASTANNHGALTATSAGISEDRRKPRSNIPSLVCAILASMTTGGTTYAFGLYGADLKAALKLKPSELDTLSTAFFVAGLVSWMPGLIVDRFGTRRGMTLGGSLGATSLVTYWLVSKKLIWKHLLFQLDASQSHSALLVPVLSILGILIFLSCALVTASVFKIIVSTSGPGTKGSAVGVAKGYVGLGAGAYACLLEALRYPKQSHLDFLPMAGLGFVMCAVIPSLVLLPTQQQMERDLVIEDEATPLHFRILYASLGTMATIIISSSMLALSDGKESHQNFLIAFLIVAVWVGPILSLLWLPRLKRQQSAIQNESHIMASSIGMERVRSTSTFQKPTIDDCGSELVDPSQSILSDVVDDADHNADQGDDEEDFPLVSAEDMRRRLAAVQQRQEAISPTEQLDYNMLEMLQTPSAMLMLWTCTMLVGAGTVETNNMGQMVEAMGFPDAVTPASLALFSVAQAASRVATGALSEHALSWNTRRFGIDKGIPRPVFFVVASMVAFVGHGILSVATHEFGFVVGVTLSGAAFGMAWPLMVLVAGEVFGTANAAANYMFYDGFTSAAGTLLLTKGLSQHVYEDHINPNSIDPDTCLGKECFELTHVLISILSLTCVMTSCAMVYTSRYAYNRPQLAGH